MIGSKPTFARNSFIGELDYLDEEFNVVIGNKIPKSMTALGIILDCGDGYNSEQEIVNMKGNYWENVPTQNIEMSIWDWDDENERRGDVLYEDELVIPHEDTPITPPRGLSVTETTLNNYSLTWDANTEEDV